jgi:antitoxin PrlF
MPPSSKASSKITSKGQVTVPQAIRRRLGLKKGDRVEFVVERGRTIIRRELPLDDDPFAKFMGVLGPFPGGEKGRRAWLKDLRDEDPEV